MRRFDLIAFDCDGVLVDSETITHGVLVSLLNELGWEITVPEAMRAFVGRNLREAVAEVEAGIGRSLPEDFFPTYRLRAHQALQDHVQAVRGVREALDGLQARQQVFCVASGAERKKMELTLGRTGLLPYFEGRMFSGMEVARTKPAPDVYLHAAASLGMQPACCAVVEDTPTGVAAGLAAGMTVFGYAGSVGKDRLLAAGAHEVFDSMADLPELLQ
jgi:HAD superfamily hydrolase (TIGR01509 family)